MNNLVRFIVLAVLILISGLLASMAQEPRSSPSIEQAIVPAQSQTGSASQPEQSAPETQQNQPSLLRALHSIEAAIRDLVAKPHETSDPAKDQRERDDLTAQQDMARWAKLMFYSTTLGVVTSLIGLFLIFRTLHHTKRTADAALVQADQARQANEQTRKIFFAEQRPLVSISQNKLLNAELMQNKLSMTVSVTLENAGKSPASDVSVIIVPLHVRYPVKNVYEEVKSLGETAMRNVQRLFVVTTLLPGKPTSVRRQLDIDIHPPGSVGSQQNQIVDYAVVVGFTHQATEQRYCTVVAYMASFSNIPTWTTFREVIHPELWTAEEIEGGTYMP